MLLFAFNHIVRMLSLLQMPNALLPQQRQEEIEQMVDSLIEKNDSPNNQWELIQSICESENITLEESDIKDISGALFKEEDEWKILLNKCDSLSRKIFTVAHELGHYFLHKNGDEEFVDGILIHTRNEDIKYQQNEVEANEFAGNLLMPRKFIEKEIGLPSGTITWGKIDLLASKFSVSTVAITTRLKNLGYA